MCRVTGTNGGSLNLIPNKLKLNGGVGVLFLPERNERGLDPVAQRLGAMEASVAGGAERNQKPRLVHSRPSMMNGQLTLRPTAAAAASIAS